MAAVTREEIELISATWIADHRDQVNTDAFKVLILNRIEGHLARLAENTSKTPELANISDKLFRLGNIISDK